MNRTASGTVRGSIAIALLACAWLPSCSATTQRRALEIALFPINVVPDIVSNTAVMFTIPIWGPLTGQGGNLWPLIWLGTPIGGPIFGIVDAWHGYPFWDPVMLDERRDYGG